MKYYWKKQEEGTFHCGQIAVSIILHITVKEAIKLFGHLNATDAKEVSKVLIENGIKCDTKLTRCKRPQLGIGALSYNNGYAHWVVVWNDKIFDGINGKKNGTVNWDKDWKITSYLRIYENA